MNHSIQTLSVIAISSMAMLLVVACSDDTTTSNTTSSSVGGMGGDAVGGTGGVGGGTGGGGGQLKPTCNNGTVEPGEVCLDGAFFKYASGITGAVDFELVNCSTSEDEDLDVLVLGQTVGITPHLGLVEQQDNGQLMPGDDLVMASPGVTAMAFDPTTNYRGRLGIVGGSTLNIVSVSGACTLTLFNSYALPGVVQGGVGAFEIDTDNITDYLTYVQVGAQEQLVHYRSLNDSINTSPAGIDDDVVAFTVGVAIPGNGSNVLFAEAATRKINLLGSNEGVLGGAGQAPSIEQTGNGLIDMVIADFNGNTFGDIISANKTDNTISVMPNDGGGYFLEPAVSVKGSAAGIMGLAPIDIDDGDIDGDGDIDVITVNEGDIGQGVGPSLTLFINGGEYSFVIATPGNDDAPVMTEWPLSVPGTPKQVRIVDFNGDGAADLLALFANGDVGVMLAKP